MATYAPLTKVSPAGIKTLQWNSKLIKDVNGGIEAQGARAVAQYATLGDFVNITEAKDNDVMARVSVNPGARGTPSIETLPAIPVEAFIRTMGKTAK